MNTLKRLVGVMAFTAIGFSGAVAPVSASSESDAWTTMSCEDRAVSISGAVEIKIATHAMHDAVHVDLVERVNALKVKLNDAGVRAPELKGAMAKLNENRNHIEATYAAMLPAWENLIAMSCADDYDWLVALNDFQAKEAKFEEAGATAQAHITNVVLPTIKSLNEKLMLATMQR